MLSVTFSRTSLSLPDLTIDDNPYAGDYHLSESGVEYPSFSVRRRYAPESDVIGGRVLLSAVRDAGALPLRIYVHGDSTAAVVAAKAALEAAATQFSYDLTLTVDGVANTWPADPELPNWGPIDSGMVKAHMAVGTLVVPLNPAVA